MRLLLLVSNIVISASLFVTPIDVYASSKTHRPSYIKGKRHASQSKKKLVDTSDVWRRVSAGLRLPRPDLELAALAEQATDDKYNYLQRATAKINQSSTLDKVAIDSDDTNIADEPEKEKYTALGRKVLNKAPRSSMGDCMPKTNRLIKPLAVDATNTRVRTQFNFHPELRQHTTFPARTVTYKTRMNNRLLNESPCLESDPKKSVQLAQNTPVLPSASQIDAPQSTSALDTEMQLLAAKQREQESLRSAKLNANKERVDYYINWYAQRPNYLYEVGLRAKPYLYHIVDSLNKHHLPLDLALLPIVESAYQPTALSPASAAGLWQFIPSTGADYNLKQDTHYDDRLDITASTQAAVSYLAFLNQRFKGDWLLALAAYNCGIGRVEDAISSNRTQGLDTDYWSLSLPEETQAYVPRLLALAKIFSNPTAHNIKLVPVKDEPYFITVKVDREPDVELLAGKDLKTIADFANVPHEQLTLLNPGYLEATLPTDRPLNFLLPIPNANQLYQRLSLLANIDKPASEQKIAPPITTTVPINTDYEVPFLSLSIPAVIVAEKPVTANTDKRTRKAGEYLTVHYVDKGETLQTIAKQFEVSSEAMRSVNKLKRKQGVFLGQRLTIPPKQVKTIMQQAINNEILEDKQMKGENYNGKA